MKPIYCVRCHKDVDSCQCATEGDDHIALEPTAGKREHTISPDCWCMPTCEFDAGECQVWVHNQEN